MDLVKRYKIMLKCFKKNAMNHVTKMLLMQQIVSPLKELPSIEKCPYVNLKMSIAKRLLDDGVNLVKWAHIRDPKQ